MSIFLPFLIPQLPLFFGRPIADGFFAKAEFAELGAANRRRLVGALERSERDVPPNRGEAQ